MKTEIDFGIRVFIRELNKQGFMTLFSCAGHKDTINSKGKVNPDVEGYVAIKGSHCCSLKLEQISQKYVQGIVIKKRRLRDQTGKQKTFAVTVVSFEPKNLRRWNGG